jgi:glycerophosphoryl diester phosphodiesterase
MGELMMPFELEALYGVTDYVVVTAHRGFSAQYPENTLPAFAAAVESGADILEFDLRGTADGVPIVLHDATFERTANELGGPGEYTLAQIKRFEASYWRGAHNDGVKLGGPAKPGTRVPTFEEVLSTVTEEVGLNIQVYDTSPAILAEICRLYAEHDLYRRGYLTLSSYEPGRRVREIDPNIEVCVLDRQGQMDVESLERQRAFGCRYIQPRRGDVTPAFCAAAREMGLYANVFYANTRQDTVSYVEMGIQGILTDRPDILISTLASLGRR